MSTDTHDHDLCDSAGLPDKVMVVGHKQVELLAKIECPCGFCFWVPEPWRTERQRAFDSFRCPQCAAYLRLPSEIISLGESVSLKDTAEQTTHMHVTGQNSEPT